LLDTLQQQLEQGFEAEWAIFSQYMQLMERPVLRAENEEDLAFRRRLERKVVDWNNELRHLLVAVDAWTF
jgi:hypothetical protein